MDREYLLSEIRRTAADNGGRALGRERFQAETGIKAREWGRYWARWGDALVEAGLEPNALQGRFDDEFLLSVLADETRRLGHVPSDRELFVLRSADPSKPDNKTFQRWTRTDLLARLVEYSRSRSDLADVASIVEATPAPRLRSTSLDVARAPDAFGTVYLIQSGRFYKLGRTNALGRRERELAIQLPERTRTIHVIATDDPVGIEAYWHSRFRDRRRNGEWFELTPADIAAFRRRKFM